MTQEKIIKEGRPFEPNCFETDNEELWYQIGLYDGATASPWISVKDRLPGEGIIVLWRSKDEIIAAYRDVKNRVCYKGGYFGTVEEFEFDYWMPIPEVPKEGDE